MSRNSIKSNKFEQKSEVITKEVIPIRETGSENMSFASVKITTLKASRQIEKFDKIKSLTEK